MFSNPYRLDFPFLSQPIDPSGGQHIWSILLVRVFECSTRRSRIKVLALEWMFLWNFLSHAFVHLVTIRAKCAMAQSRPHIKMITQVLDHTPLTSKYN